MKFTLFPRLTSHVRHKAKYQDLQLVAEQGFWFTEQSHPSAGPARSLKELLAMLDRAPSAVVAGHVRRGDFSRWIAGAFRDHALASQVRKVEQRFRLGHVRDLTQSISRLIQERYEFSVDRDKDAVIPLPALERN